MSRGTSSVTSTGTYWLSATSAPWAFSAVRCWPTPSSASFASLTAPEPSQPWRHEVPMFSADAAPKALMRLSTIVAVAP